MKNWQKAGLAAAAALLMAMPAEAAEVSQNAVLSGKVTSVVEVNTPVKEGQVLATVDSLVGPVPAVRADTDGVVTKVLVVKGQQINKQDAVAVINACNGKQENKKTGSFNLPGPGIDSAGRSGGISPAFRCKGRHAWLCENRSARHKD